MSTYRLCMHVQSPKNCTSSWHPSNSQCISGHLFGRQWQKLCSEGPAPIRCPSPHNRWIWPKQFEWLADDWNERGGPTTLRAIGQFACLNEIEDYLKFPFHFKPSPCFGSHPYLAATGSTTLHTNLLKRSFNAPPSSKCPRTWSISVKHWVIESQTVKLSSWSQTVKNSRNWVIGTRPDWTV